LQWIYMRRNTVVVIDELMEVAPSSLSYPRYLKGILTRGRQLGIGCWCLTQRPKEIPIISMTESTHFFIFRLNIDEDRERISKIIGHKELMIQPKIPYSFWYYNVRSNKNPTLGILK
jgi:DNA helicase HerA-like ATPase